MTATTKASPPGRLDSAHLAATMTGWLTTPDDPDWDQARLAWNVSVDQHPDLVATVADAADVVRVVRYARANGLRVAPQGTGHNAAVLGDLTGTILLRTDRMREVTVSPSTRTVRVGAGVVWGEVTQALAPHGLTALAGSSPDVGVVGLTLGGGYSWLSRSRGLTASAVTAAEVVTGDGVLHRVDADHEPELFWAVRGGAGNAGVVSALELSAFELSEVCAGSMLFPLERAHEVLTAYEQWTTDLSEAVTTCVSLTRLPMLPELPEPIRGQSFVIIDGAVDAPAPEAAALLEPMRRLGPVLDSFATMPTSALDRIHMDPPGPTPARGDGLIIDDLDSAAIDALLALAGPAATTSLLTVGLRHLGGAIGRRAPAGGAVDHLPGRFLVYGVGITPTADAVQVVERDVQELVRALTPWSADRDYANFRETPVPAERFYDRPTRDRLLAVRAEHDPDVVVRSNHEWGPLS